MNVSLISYTGLPDAVCGQAAAICYNSSSPLSALCGAMDSGHNSVLEHAHFTFQIEGVSRSLLAQLTRHRIASFSVQSQRYVSMERLFDFVTPPAIADLGAVDVLEYERQMRMIHKWYCEWQKKLMANGRTDKEANEDARFVLPNAACTRLIMTMNARELLHLFELRCCNRAQWEIREMAWRMLRICYKTVPVLFAEAGPGCINGKGCPEGKMSCGIPFRQSDRQEGGMA